MCCFYHHKTKRTIIFRRVLLAKKSDLVGVWSTEWQIMFTEMNAPECFEKSVKLELKKKQKGFFGMGTSNGKVVEFSDAATAEVSV